MHKITPFLWFNTDAEDAADFYLSVFASGRKVSELRAPAGAPAPAGSLMVITLELEGQQMTFLNGGPGHPLTEAFSFSVVCETQEEIDGYWDKLVEGGSPMACGWLKDKYGLCWQIVPARLQKLVSTPGGMKAMMSMVKFDIAALEKAAAG
ncbi:VOC family protein [Granulicella sibirica]|uniref:3-demethylubiquinone-9 3-methyltransferase n=1 Tax=Granulicella sibirica TaxID=2479048 RepID=A0A4Q0TAA7_9BACT|nr:VOC family protein [Granulicella sibirica]RXH58929.1 3-demethylubiquinone-9 3-methyltransferase [Granulicella sibirica]